MKKMYTAINSDGRKISLSIDSQTYLAQIRQLLQQSSTMSDDDLFIFNNAEILKVQENEIKLKDIASTNLFYIGECTKNPILSTETGVDAYINLTRIQRKELLANAPVLNGITITSDGKFKWAFKTAASLNQGYIPAAQEPHINTETSITTQFDEVSHEMSMSGVSNASVSVNVVQVNNEAEFKKETSNTQTLSRITEYMLARYIVRKVDLQIDISELTPEPQLVEALRKAVEHQPNTITGCCNVLRVLNEWGYYIPKALTLGGVLYSSDKKTVSEYSQIAKNKEEFTNSFKASFDRLGVGLNAGYSSESTTTDKSTHKTTMLLVQQIGGIAGTTVSTTDYSNWASSLNSATYWNICDVTAMTPILDLVRTADYNLVSTCVDLLSHFASYPDALKLQKYFNVKKYALDLLSESVGEYY